MRRFRVRRHSFFKRVAERIETIVRSVLSERRGRSESIRIAFARFRDAMSRRARRVEPTVNPQRVDRTRASAREERRRMLIAAPETYAAEAMTASPIRLINHRLCKTSKPTYIHAIAALYTLPEKVRGVYVAVANIIDRVRLPMVRRLWRWSKSLPEPWGSLIRALVQFALKPSGRKMTTIVKVADRIGSWLERIPILRTIDGLEQRIEFAVAAFMSHIVERLRAIALGARELMFYRRIRHCSTYVRIEGLRYTGLPSPWYYWKRRFVLCSEACGDLDGYARGVCVSVCNSMLKACDPEEFAACFEAASTYAPQLARQVSGA